MSSIVGIDEERFNIGFYVLENRSMDSFATFYTDDGRTTVDVTVSDCPYCDHDSKFSVPKKDFIERMREFLDRIESGTDAHGKVWAEKIKAV